MKKILGLIPARAGSKGVPLKNIKLLHGKPLIQYTIESALNSELISKVFVSTESSEIAEISIALGAKVPFLRPMELATDTAPTLPVVVHVLERLLEEGEKFDAVCILQATSPFRPNGFIDMAIKKFIHSDADSLISVLPVPHEYNPHWIFEPSSNGYLKIATGEKKIIARRQELPAGYYRDGSIYLTKTEVLLKTNSVYGEKIDYIVSDKKYYVNIDTMEDWNNAERKYADLMPSGF